MGTVQSVHSPMSRDERAFMLDWVKRWYGLRDDEVELKLESIQLEESQKLALAKACPTCGSRVFRKNKSACADCGRKR